MFRCPTCFNKDIVKPLVESASGLSCANNHNFDRAKQGYINLLVGKKPHVGDSAQMVDARIKVHEVGVFDSLIERLDKQVSGLVVDLGCGPGQYLSALTSAEQKVGLDSSTVALRRAGRLEGLTALGADLLEPLPFFDNSVDTVLSIFAPRPFREIHRILKPDGKLIVISPTSSHLKSLRSTVPAMLDIPSDKKLSISNYGVDEGFSIENVEELAYPIKLDEELAFSLIYMGPAAFHHSEESIRAQLQNIPLEDFVSVYMHIFTR